MPPWLEAVLLGIVQGVTEFLPISSDGHLAVIPYLAGMRLPGLALTVALHVGTFLAIIAYFHQEVWLITKGLLHIGKGPDERLYRRLGIYVLLGSIPTGVVGVLFRDAFSDLFESPLAAAAFLLVTAAFLWVGEFVRDRRVRRAAAVPVGSAHQPQRIWNGNWIGTGTPVGDAEAISTPIGEEVTDPSGRTLKTLTLRDALLVGLFQPLALLPGVSRSGTTIVAGLASGLTREAATRFSFLLTLPALAGAFILELPALAEPGPYSGMHIALGVATAFVAGYIAVRFLVRLVARDRLTGFARYCVFLAIVVFVAYQFLGPPSAV